ncbi:MAG: ABC transporter permease [Dehalococcoidia bacterium]|nr:ABC transporter permease [Dehalococcoidia bacterium]
MAQAIEALPAAPPRRRVSPQRLWRTARHHPMASVALCVIVVFVLIAVLAPLIAPYDPAETNGRNRLQSPSWSHPFGTDSLGRDVLSREIFGARVSLQVAVLAVAVAAGVGVPLGLLSGYRGGWIDVIVMRATDAVIAFPGLVLALTLVLVLGPSITNIMVALGIGAAPNYARLVRGQVLSLRNMDYILAARSIGAGDTRIMVRYLWPNTLPSVIVAGTLTMGSAILAEASLSFLGVGVRPPTPTWGGMLNEAFTQIYVAPFLSFFPGLAIFIITLSFNLLGDGVRDLLDPRLRTTQGL